MQFVVNNLILAGGVFQSIKEARALGFFDTLKIMKDIVTGGIEAYEAGEKLDELIEKVEDEYEDALTAEDKARLKEYKTTKKAYDDNTDREKNDKLLGEMEDARLSFLEALEDNSTLPKSLRNEIRTQIEEFKTADNKALNSLGSTLEKYAETDEQRTEIRKTLNESKRK